MKNPSIFFLFILFFISIPKGVESAYYIQQNGQVNQVAGFVLGDSVSPTPEVDEYWKRPTPVVDDYKNRPTWYPGATRPPTWTPVTRAPTWKPEPTRKSEIKITPYLTKPAEAPKWENKPTKKPSLTPKPTRTEQEYKELYLKIRDSKNKELKVPVREEVVVETLKQDIILKQGDSQTVELKIQNKTIDIKLPVVVDSVSKEVSVGTSTGEEVKIQIEPKTIDQVYKEKIQELNLQVGQTPSPEVGIKTEVVEEDGKVVYKVEAEKTEKLFGILPIKIKHQATLDAQDGNLISEEKSAFTKFIDLFSF